MVGNPSNIDLSEVDYVSPSTIIDGLFNKYKWKDDEEYLKKRLYDILDQLDERYDIKLAEEKAGLYFVNDFYVRFN